MSHFKKYTKEDYQSIEWRIKSIEIKIRDDFICHICGGKESLNVHHILYILGRRIWDYPNEYLITLCRFHHGVEHGCLKTIDINKWKQALLSGLLAQDIINIE